jgi:xanthine/CO dehydrogenase XdhC/CoxF family maturation factor
MPSECLTSRIPIGPTIGTITPAEIAISILAELIAASATARDVSAVSTEWTPKSATSDAN